MPKIDPSEQHRAEIEARTAAGETCEQIAAALRAQGIAITDKTVSRRRLEWGLRQRAFSKHKNDDTPRPPRPKRPAKVRPSTQARRAEIEARTLRGESPEGIADALRAKGLEVKNGASTVSRLQSKWGLVPSEVHRKRARLRQRERNGAASERTTTRRAERTRRPAEPVVARVHQTQETMHYPANCSFGPKKRVNGVERHQDLPEDTDDQSPFIEEAVSQPASSTTAEIMSVEFLVDLATSTLAAAINLKEMLLAHQDGRALLGSSSAPTLQDLSTARRKVREAAKVMHDLAVEPDDSAPT